ncbi:GvpL/GvpF family gas vesicle protein [Streptomyces sp. CBMA152]|uniref:GvpL/GvpF family gas vesicle protein n=1 Tax=Streptomyces sp. CBMA152 TaxID=1896312 RepID=UPI001660B9A9|nr:GvpL/GvpF family gas vesicle protein [Streptomyces sp. CBMA152]MBD0742837.1 gas vesicle protein [Streptomyces sp. CBMA152]
MGSDLLYVYAVVRPFAGALPDGVCGLDGTPPRLVEDRGLCAVVSPVHAEDFDAIPLRDHLEDLDWLAATATTHQEVTGALFSVTCAVPLRLATVCRGEAGVRRLLGSGRAGFVRALERLDGRVEWGVKVYADIRPAPAGAPPTSARPADGREYLRRRLGQRRSREEVWRRADALSRTLHTELSGRAEAGRLHRPQNVRLSGDPGENILNAAYLVPREQSEEFVATVRHLTPHTDGVRVELTGPWAPHSFAGEAGQDAERET